MEMMNLLHELGLEGRSHGFQLTSLKTGHEDLLDNDKSQQRIETGDLIVYIDAMSLLVKVSAIYNDDLLRLQAFDEDGMEEDVSFSYNRFRDFAPIGGRESSSGAADSSAGRAPR